MNSLVRVAFLQLADVPRTDRGMLADALVARPAGFELCAVLSPLSDASPQVASYKASETGAVPLVPYRVPATGESAVGWGAQLAGMLLALTQRAGAATGACLLLTSPVELLPEGDATHGQDDFMRVWVGAYYLRRSGG